MNLRKRMRSVLRWRQLFAALIAAVCFSLAGPAAFALDEQAERYVKLALEFGEYDADYVDAYLGPEPWRKAARANLRPLDELAGAIEELHRELQTYEAPDGAFSTRHRALLKNVQAMATRARIVRGETVPFAEEARLLYDVELPDFDFTEFDMVLQEIDGLMPGEGDLADRVDAFRRQLEIPDESRNNVIDLAIEECRRRSLQFISLPDSERFSLEYVTDRSWSGYNWYQGNNESLLQINIDQPLRIGSAVTLGCHEGYPGHHVWNVLLENRLLMDNGWVEFSVFPLFSPFALIAEGSANFGVDLAFPGDEKIAFERNVLFPAAGLDPDNAEILMSLTELTSRLQHATTAVAELYLDGAISRDEAIELTRRYNLSSSERAERSVRFIEQYRSYVLNYGIGEEIVKAYVERQGEDPASRWNAFERMLTELYTASDMIE